MKSIFIAMTSFVLVTSAVVEGADEMFSKKLTVKDLIESGFKPLKKDGRELDPKANGLDRHFESKESMVKFFDGIGLDYNKIRFDKSSNIFVNRKLFQYRGCFWHVREMIGVPKNEKGETGKMDFHVYMVNEKTK